MIDPNEERRRCDPPTEEPDEPDMKAEEREYWSRGDDAYDDYKSSGERRWWRVTNEQQTKHTL